MTGPKKRKSIGLAHGVERRLLPNGLTVVTREDHSVPIVTTMIWYRVGSRYETPGITGISHFLEHMMFKGTERYGKGEIDYLTTINGGSNNAFTSRDYTAYYFSFASDRWQDSLEIEADRMVRNRFDPDEFELERQVILEELRMELDSPWGALRQAVETRAFDVHPYRHPVIGNKEDVENLRLDRMIGFYRSYYCPTNAILCICGDFETSEALRLVERNFGSIPSQAVPDPETVIEPKRCEQVRLRLQFPTNLERLLVAFPAPSVADPDHYAVEILDKILSDGKLARLYRRLIEETRVASLVATDFDETLDPYLFFVRAELQPGSSAPDAEAVLFEELRRLEEDGPSDEELRRAKNQCLTQLIGDFETTIDQSVQLGLMETVARFEYWNHYPAELAAVTPFRVAEVTAKYFRPERATVGILEADPHAHPTAIAETDLGQDEEE